MNSIFAAGARCWLDRETEVVVLVVLKAVTRSHSTYNVEVPGKRIETVSVDRLTLIDLSSTEEDVKSGNANQV